MATMQQLQELKTAVQGKCLGSQIQLPSPASSVTKYPSLQKEEFYGWPGQKHFLLRSNPTALSHLPSGDDENYVNDYSTPTAGDMNLQVLQNLQNQRFLPPKTSAVFHQSAGFYMWQPQRTGRHMFGLHAPYRYGTHFGFYRRLKTTVVSPYLQVDLHVTAQKLTSGSLTCFLVIDSNPSATQVVRKAIRLGYLGSAPAASPIPAAPQTYYQRGAGFQEGLQLYEETPYCFDFSWKDTAPVVGFGLIFFASGTSSSGQYASVQGNVELFRRV